MTAKMTAAEYALIQRQLGVIEGIACSLSGQSDHVADPLLAAVTIIHETIKLEEGESIEQRRVQGFHGGEEVF